MFFFVKKTYSDFLYCYKKKLRICFVIKIDPLITILVNFCTPWIRNFAQTGSSSLCLGHDGLPKFDVILDLLSIDNLHIYNHLVDQVGWLVGWLVDLLDGWLVGWFPWFP